MTAVLGFVTIGLFLVLTMTKRVSVIVALVAIPVVTAVIGGHAGELGTLVAKGVVTVAPVAVMITFAILYFSLMLDEGLFDPAIRRILAWAKGDPMKLTVGTAILTLLVALDGDGASTFLITVSAMLPLYKRIGMRPLVLTGVVCLGAGVMNLVPWGGPTARAMAALHLDSSELFIPIIPAMVAGIAWVLVAAYLIGRKERKRLGTVELVTAGDGPGAMLAERRQLSTGARVRFWFNLLLTIALVVTLLWQVLPLEVLFMLAFTLALLVNRPQWSRQQELLEKYGYSVLLVTAMIFAAGAFTGVLNGTGMIKEMAEAMVSVVSPDLSGALPVLTAVTSMPLSLVFTPDAYYFGVLPVIAQTATSMGVDPAEIGRAAILGQMTTGFPLSPLTASTFILMGMAGVELGDHQRFIFKWAFGTTLVMTVVALLIGAITL